MSKICIKGCPKYALCLAYPSLAIAQWLNKHRISFSWILYDPYFCSPLIKNKKQAIAIERKLALEAKTYFVPSFCEAEYKVGQFSHIEFYSLPLALEDGAIEELAKGSRKLFDAAYFGTMQSFRKTELLNRILSRTSTRLSCFGKTEIKDTTFIDLEEPVPYSKMVESMACSSVLVVVDNSRPYDVFFPSKAIIYASLGKPILAMGDDPGSELAAFLKSYQGPSFYCSSDKDINDACQFLRKWTSIFVPPSTIWRDRSKFQPNSFAETIVNEIRRVN